MPTDADPNASSASNTECFICLLRLRKFLFRYHGRQSGVTRSCKQCHCVVGAHIVCRDHPSNYPIDVRTGRTRGHRDIACVKRHMPALDTFGGKRAQRAHVLREADSDSNLAEILSRVHIHDLEGDPGERMRLGGPANKTHGHRHLEGAHRTTVTRFLPVVSDVYRPFRHAYACAPASTARQSLPVATITGSMPFMIPLLCVAARYGSMAANRHASITPSITCSPEYSLVVSVSAE